MTKLVFYQEGKEIDLIDFGILIPGETARIVIQVKNEAPTQMYGLEFNLSQPEVEIIKKPAFINAGETEELILQYTASINAEKGIQASINVKGRYVV